MTNDVNLQAAMRGVLRHPNQMIEKLGEEFNVWQVDFFTPSGKWKYTDFVVMTKPERWAEFDVLIQKALDNTPSSIRETSINSIEHWTVIMINNPLGFPIMVVGKDADDR